jgi:hypothetical protein
MLSLPPKIAGGNKGGRSVVAMANRGPAACVGTGNKRVRNVLE